MNLKVVSKEAKSKAFDELSKTLISIIDKIRLLNEDIRLSSLEVAKQFDMITRLDTGIESLVFSMQVDGKKVYTNSLMRDNAVKQRKFDNSVYQELVIKRAKWNDELSKLRIEKENLERELKIYKIISELFVSVRL